MVTEEEIVQCLENDTELNFRKTVGNTLREGVCPSCGKRELYIKKDKPYQLKCPRENHCGYQESTRSRYPHLWEDLSKRVPATESDPKATAKAFLEMRGFDASKIINMFTQDIRKMPTPDGQFVNVDVLRFPLWPGSHWDRLLNETDVRKVGAKARVSSGITYAGECWTPSNFALKKDDECFITEGIFHSLAFLYTQRKSVAAISSSNFPWALIKSNTGKNITWIIAFDDDPAGHKYALKYYEKMAEMGEKVKIALTGSSSQDWDEIYKAGNLNADFITESLWRGDVLKSKTVIEKAYHMYRNNKRSKNIIDFAKKLWQITVDSDQLNDQLKLKTTTSQPNIDIVLNSPDGYSLFTNNTKKTAISNCLPIFKHCEKDKVTGESTYYFEIQSTNGDCQIKLPGTCLGSPQKFNDALMTYAIGSTFDGDAFQMKMLRDKWFNHGIEHVSTVPFIGYDKQSGIYIFPTFAYYHGRELTMNKFGYVTQGEHKLKTTSKNFEIQTNDQFNPEWLGDFINTFHWNGLVVLAFWMGTLFAEQIRLRHASYPFLEMSGEPGTGKSTLLEFLWKCVGRDNYEGFDPSKATAAARARSFIQVSNLPVVMIEGDRSKDGKKGAFDYNELKTAYNGRAVRSTGAFTRGNETIEPPFRGAIVLAQNAEIDAEKAVIERIVHVHFTKAHFTEASYRLSNVFAQKKIEELCGFMPTALKKQNTIMDTFEKEFTRIEDHYKKSGLMKNGRIIKNHAQVAALGYSLTHIFPGMEKKDASGKTRADLLVNFLELRGLSREKRLVDDHPLVAQFWEVYELLENGMDGDKVTRVNHSAKDKEIAINMAHMWQEAMNHKLPLPLQSDIKPLLATSIKYKFLDSNKSMKSGLWQGKPVRCWIFTTEKPEKQ